MHTIDLTRGPRRGGPARRLLVVALPVVAAAAVLAAGTVASGGGPSGSPRSGPTAEVATRDLATSLAEQGALQRTGEQLVSHAGALSPGGSDTPGGGDTPEADGGAVTPVSYVAPAPASTAPATSSSSTTSTSSTPSSSTTSTPSSTTSTTTDPCPTGGSSTTTSSTSSTSTTDCPPTSTTTVPTTPSTTSTTAPPDPDDPPPGGTDGPPSDRAPEDGGNGDREDASGQPDGDDGPTGGPAGGPVDGGDGGVLPGGGDDSDGDDESVPSAVLTSVADVGATAGAGTVLYTADDQPVVSLVGDLPAWRTLEAGVDDGADVRQLEENLVALGYGAGLDVDEAFTADTAAAVEAWEVDLGRTAPDGVVAIGDVVFVSAPGDVLGHEASVGDTLDPGSPVLTLGADQRVVLASVDATEAGGWAAGSVVAIEWADGTTAEGIVFGPGRDVTDGEVDLVVAVDDTAAGGRGSGAEATLTLVDARRDGALAVPVAAVVDDGGAPAVRVVRDGGPDVLVPVDTGLVADGWVEITDGVEAGEEVRLPG